MRKVLSFFAGLFTWVVIGIFALLGIFTLFSNTGIFFGARSFLVQSGSMEPTIMTGDVIVVQPQTTYAVNDTITFRGSENRIVTHRIIGIEKSQTEEQIVTKGDANRAEDNDRITKGDIIGKVTLVIPKIGFLLEFSRTIPGLILLIGIPALLLIIDELLNILHAQ